MLRPGFDEQPRRGRTTGLDLRRYGHGLRAGELVTTGTTTAPVPVGPGDEIRAGFGELGEVSFRFAG